MIKIQLNSFVKCVFFQKLMNENEDAIKYELWEIWIMCMHACHPLPKKSALIYFNFVANIHIYYIHTRRKVHSKIIKLDKFSDE